MRAISASVLLFLALATAPAAAGAPVPVSSPDPVVSPDPVAASRAEPGGQDATDRRKVPRLRVRSVVTGLDHPWDVQSLGRGRLIYTQRDRATLSVWRDGRSRRLRFPGERIWVSGETGLMAVEVDPRFRENRRVYTCSGWGTEGGGHDVRVIAWRLTNRLTRARRLRTLVDGFPTSSGRHGGCALEVTRNGSLLVGTGDAAEGSNPRDKRSLGGKTLRLDRFTGEPWPSNRWAHARNRDKRYVFTFGHRNVQGLAERHDGSLWSVEQGSFRDDEVNRLRRGGDYGWHPVPGYDESVPMTDHSLPGRQVAARWRSGNPTLATSGASFVYGKTWGRLSGALAVGVLKDQQLLFVKFDRRGRLKWTRSPRALRSHGRLRSVSQAPNGRLYVTTDNGEGRDAILEVTPRRRR